MNDQPPVIVANQPSLPPPASKPTVNLNLIFIILIALLSMGTIGFGIASLNATNKANHATATLTSAKLAAAAAAKAEQQQTDAAASLAAAQSPYRSFVAPSAYGSFVVNFPKNWNMTIDEEENSQTQVSLVLNPDFIRRVNSVDDLAATKVQLVQRTLSDYLTQFTSKGIVQATTTVSGITGTVLTGTLPDKRDARIVAVPVRDKTLLFINENGAFSATFDTILAQAKINP